MRNHFENIKMPKDTSNNKNSYDFDTATMTTATTIKQTNIHTKQYCEYICDMCEKKCCLRLFRYDSFRVQLKMVSGFGFLYSFSIFCKQTEYQISMHEHCNTIWKCSNCLNFVTTAGFDAIRLFLFCFAFSEHFSTAWLLKMRFYANLFL